MPENNEGFVSRWSRRKQQVASEDSDQRKEHLDYIENSIQVPEEEINPEVLKAEKLEALNKLTDEDMPDIETLNEDSDFSGFMSTSVSEGLRNMALKKLFMGKSYNVCDGLDDYDGDYTVFDKMPADMVTSDMKHMIGVEAKKQLAKEEEEARQELIASGELDEKSEGLGEVEEFDQDENILAEAQEEYIDEYINVDGFDTSGSSLDEDQIKLNNINNDINGNTKNDINNDINNNDNEEVA